MAFSVPDLPYAYDALEPHIDEATMRVHHDKHHQAYVDKANAALEGTEWADRDRRGRPAQPRRACRGDKQTAGPQQRRRSRQPLAVLGDAEPRGGGEPERRARGRDRRRRSASFDALQGGSSTTPAIARFGSGWAWLVHDGTGLAVLSTPNQDSPVSDGSVAAPRLDVWEHAYYLKYQNRRPDYIEALWNVVNWDYVAQRFAAAG